MIARSVCVGGQDRNGTATLSAALADEGFVIKPVEEAASPIDIAAYIDRIHPPGSIASSPPEAWIRSVTDDISAAFRFVRAAIPRFGAESGLIVFVTSLAGRIGVPGRTLDSVVAAGLGGIVVSLPHEVPALASVDMTGTIPSPPILRAQADVIWPATDAPGLDDAGTMRAVAHQIRYLGEREIFSWRSSLLSR